MRRSTVCLIILLCTACLPSLTLCGQFYPRGHDLEGLPDTQAPWRVYADDPAHSLNRLHRLLFSESLVPAEVQAQLPGQRSKAGQADQDFYVAGWYFKKVPGGESDRQTFGGDVRVSPRQSFTEVEQKDLMMLLREVQDWRGRPELQSLAAPTVRLMLQWDILSVWWQLERANSKDNELLIAMAQAIQALAQEAQVLERVPSGLSDLVTQFPTASSPVTAHPFLPPDLSALDESNQESNWTEVGRRSTQLFNAERSLRVSKAYINTGSRAGNLDLIDRVTAGKPNEVEIPDGTQTLLVMQIIGIDAELNPVATPLIDELRVRVAQGPAELSVGSSTSSRDGSSHWIYMRSRLGTLKTDEPDFRFVPDTAQALFVEYGTRKHATFAAQCALCHRRTNDGSQAPAGIRMFSKIARPHVAEPRERERLAVSEMKSVVERLKVRLASTNKPVEKDKGPQVKDSDATASNETEGFDSGSAPRRPARAERTADERLAWIADLRKAYQQSTDKWPAPNVDRDVTWRELGTLPAVVHPESNAFSENKKKLGEMLFFDPRLSGSQQLACASCHDPDLGWADGKTLSFGHSRAMLSRNTPSIRNAGHWNHLFWDGRAGSLEEQVLHVLANPSEMRANEVDVVARLREQSEYQKLFELSFGDPSITLDRIAQAIACFERTVVGGYSRFDAFIKGKYTALTDSELVGLDLFRREARCINCHNGPLFSDNQFHNVGLSYYGRKFEDLGRYNTTSNAADVGKFRTPSLRDITRTTPLMHNGLFELPGVLNMYNAGMPTLKPKAHELDDARFPVKSPHLKPLQLNRTDLQDLAAFLASLEEPKRRVWPPLLPGMDPPKLGLNR